MVKYCNKAGREVLIDEKDFETVNRLTEAGYVPVSAKTEIRTEAKPAKSTKAQ